MRVGSVLLALSLLLPATALLAAGGSPVFLTGTTIVLDGSASQGSPTGFGWTIQPPGGAEPIEIPECSDPQYLLLLDRHGTWQVTLHAHYAHENPEGSLYTDDEGPVSIEAKSVVADLVLPADPVPFDQEIVLDGSASQVADGVTPTITWTVEGPESFQCPADSGLVCTIPADTFSVEGTYTVTLQLDGDGDLDTATGTFQVIDDSLAVDFTWEETLIPRRMTFDATLTPATATAALAEWNFGDGSEPSTYSCAFSNCLTGIQHDFPADGTYDVTVTVTVDGTTERPTATHSVPVGDVPDPPVASFSVSPGTAIEAMTDAQLTFDGTCEGDCTWSWDFGDGATGEGASVTHAWPRSGSFDVTMTVTNVSGSDTATATVTVTDCWTPPAPSITGTAVPDTVCWGDTLIASYGDDVGTGFVWSTGSTGPTADVSPGGSFWVTVDDGTPCWGTVEFSVTGVDCGDPGADADHDGSVDGRDLGVLLLELTDGDGDSVTDSGGGSTLAPGGDVTGDGILDGDDVLAILQKLFAEPELR